MKKVKAEMDITGECFCGEMEYHILAPLKEATICHCSRCRKAFGGAGSAFAAVGKDHFKWNKGEENLQTYVGKEGWGIGFCKKCGTTLCGIYQGEVAGIDVGTLNNNPEVKIKEHIFVGSKACWDDIGGDVPQFDEFGSGY